MSQPVYKSTQNKQTPSSKCLLNRRHFSSDRSKRQSRARSSRSSITEADEADLGNSKTHALSSQDEGYNYIPNKEDIFRTKSPQGNAVKVWKERISEKITVFRLPGNRRITLYMERRFSNACQTFLTPNLSFLCLVMV